MSDPAGYNPVQCSVIEDVGHNFSVHSVMEGIALPKHFPQSGSSDIASLRYELPLMLASVRSLHVKIKPSKWARMASLMVSADASAANAFETCRQRAYLWCPQRLDDDRSDYVKSAAIIYLEYIGEVRLNVLSRSHEGQMCTVVALQAVHMLGPCPWDFVTVPPADPFRPLQCVHSSLWNHGLRGYEAYRL